MKYSKKLADCSGHFGYIQLELPVFHVGYLRHTLAILQCICKKCSRILLPQSGSQGMDRISFLKRLKRSHLMNEDALTKASIFKKVIETCKKNTICCHCKYSNGIVKKIGGTFKLVHEKYRAKNNTSIIPSEITSKHPDLKLLNSKYVENINPVRAYELFCNITEEDMILLWMNGEYGR